MSVKLTINGWIGLVIGALRSHGFNFLEQGLEMSSPDDPRKTNACLIPLTELRISLVLGMRAQESGEGREAFLEVRNGFTGSVSDVAVCITHVIERGDRIWEYRSERDFIPDLDDGTKTEDIIRSLAWVDAIAVTIKTQIAAIAPPTPIVAPPP